MVVLLPLRNLSDERRPKNPQKLLTRYYGEFEHPDWEIINELRSSSQNFKENIERNKKHISLLENDIESVKNTNKSAKLWRGLFPSLQTTGSARDMLARIVDKKSPKEKMVPNAMIDRAQFIQHASNPLKMSVELRDKLLSLLFPNNAKSPIEDCPLKSSSKQPLSDEQNGLVDAFIAILCIMSAEVDGESTGKSPINKAKSPTTKK